MLEIAIITLGALVTGWSIVHAVRGPRCKWSGSCRIAICGDSILSGSAFTQAISSGLPRYSVENYSVPGAGSAQILGTLQGSVLSQSFDEVIIMAGMNDLSRQSPEYVLNNIEQMVKSARRAGLRVIVMSITPYSGAPHLIRRINSELSWKSPFWGASRYVNVWSLLADTDGGLLSRYSGDVMGLHPNPDGQRVMARRVLSEAF